MRLQLPHFFGCASCRVHPVRSTVALSIVSTAPPMFLCAPCAGRIRGLERRKGAKVWHK